MHPRYFDSQALTACWREGLLAQAVLDNPESGYGRHPQLERFRSHPCPAAAMSQYLSGIADEADRRGFHFSRGKIAPAAALTDPIPVATGQLRYEWQHLMAKLQRRSRDIASRWSPIQIPEPHPLFLVVAGPIATWERPKAHPSH